MKKLLFAMLALVALASCSKDEVVQINQDEIKFSVVTENATKASAVYCQNNMISTFNVWAEYTENGTTWAKYFANKTVTESNGEWGSTAVHYWPDLGTDSDNYKMRFYAVAGTSALPEIKKSATPSNTDWAGDGTAPVIENFSPNTTVADQQDLLYSVANIETTPNDGNATLNFRHALSQIVFNAKNLNPNIYVEIYGVKVCNVVGTKTFTFNTGSTSDQVIDHNQNGKVDGEPAQDGSITDTETDVTITNQGTWSNEASGEASYEATLDAAATLDLTTGTEVIANVTTEKLENNEYGKNAMLLLPQTTTAWAPASYTTPAARGQTGSYILLNCKIWNKSDASGVKKDNSGNITDVLLWNNKKTVDDSEVTQYVAIPFAANWEQGKKYTYTFVFKTQGNGGYDPEDGTEVLTPIKLDVTIDDFTNGGQTDVDMNKNVVVTP